MATWQAIIGNLLSSVYTEETSIVASPETKNQPRLELQMTVPNERPNLDPDLPRVLAGPLLRHVQADRLMPWLVTTTPTTWRFRLHSQVKTLEERDLATSKQTELPIGRHAYVQLLEVHADTDWPTDCLLHYDLAFEDNTGWHGIADWAPHLCHEGQQSPHIVIQSRVRRYTSWLL